jgi:hypothetical protein
MHQYLCDEIDAIGTMRIEMGISEASGKHSSWNSRGQHIMLCNNPHNIEGVFVCNTHWAFGISVFKLSGQSLGSNAV